MANQSRRLANAVRKLAGTVNSAEPHIKITDFTAACSLLVATKLGFGQAFLLADLEVKNKVKELEKRVNEDDTIQSVLRRELQENTAGDGLSASRSVLRLKRSMEMAMVFVDLYLQNNIRSTETFHSAIGEAFAKVFRQLHGPTNLQAFHNLESMLPPLSRFLRGLCEDGESVKEPFEIFLAASKVVIDHIESVFKSREESARLLGLI